MTSDQSGAEQDRLRLWKTVATVALILVLLSPVVRNGDGVPLSSYPMYAVPRQDVIEFIVPVAVTHEGTEESLSIQTIAATRDPLVAETYLRREVAAGRAGGLCEQIAARVQNDAVQQIEVRVELHNVVDRARGHDSLVEMSSVASCPA